MPVIKEILKSLRLSSPEEVSRGRTISKNSEGASVSVKPEARKAVSRKDISALQKLADSIGLEIKTILLKFQAKNLAVSENSKSAVEEPLAPATGESYIKATNALLNHNLSRLLQLIESSGVVSSKNVEALRTDYQKLINFNPRSQNEVEMYVRQLKSFFSQLVSAIKSLPHREMISVKLIMEDIFRLFASPQLIKSLSGELNISSMFNSGLNQSLDKPMLDIAYLNILSRNPMPEADYLSALSKD